MTTKVTLIAMGLGICRFTSGQPAVVGSVYQFQAPFNVAPGQLVTLTVEGLSLNIYETVTAPPGADLPTSLEGVSVGFGQILGPNMPLLQVRPYSGCPGETQTGTCSPIAAITAQIPFEAVCNACAVNGGVPNGIVSAAEGSAHGGQVFVNVFPDHVHVLTACDALLTTYIGAPTDSMGIPCASVVTHADGSPVSAKSPAQPGEVVVAWAVGLGQTSPPLATGKLVTAPASTQETYLLDFNYRPNALAAKPPPGSPQPVYAGASPGYVGLYQVNFTIPPVPAGTPPCVDTTNLPIGSNVVQSNLTVSIGGQSSFDAARLCVAAPNQ